MKILLYIKIFEKLLFWLFCLSLLGFNTHAQQKFKIKGGSMYPNAIYNKGFKGAYYEGYSGNSPNWDYHIDFFILTSKDDLYKLPQTLKLNLYKKKDNSFVKSYDFFSGNNLREIIKSTPCPANKEQEMGIAYYRYPLTGSDLDIPDNVENEALYFLTEPVCCRETTDNFKDANSPFVALMELAPRDSVDLTSNSKFTFGYGPNRIERLSVCKNSDFNITASFWYGLTLPLGSYSGTNISKVEGAIGDFFTKGTTLPYQKVDLLPPYSYSNLTGTNNPKKVTVTPNSYLIGNEDKEGKYTYSIKTTAYQGNMRLSVVYNESQFIVEDCPKQTTPTVFASKVGSPNIASKLTLCSDSLIQLNAKDYTSGGAYQWLKNNTPVIGAKDSLFVIRTNESGSYSLRITNPKMCNKEVVSNTLSVSFLSKPTTTVTASSPTGTLCQGGIVKLTAVSSPSNVKYQWLRENVAVNGATNSIFDASESGNYTVRITTNEGCTNLSTAQNVVSNTPPKAEITSSTKVICKGKDVSISATSGTGNTYVWTRDGVTIPENTATFTTNQTGNYVVKITAPNTCSTVSKPFKVIQLDNPEVIIVNPNGIQLCQGSTINFTLKGNALQSFQWLKDGQILANETKNTLSVSQAGEYTVSVIDTNGCANTSLNEKINIVNKVIVTLDSIPPICGTNSPIIALKASPSGGTFSGLGVSGSDFNPNISGIGTHKITYNINGNLACLTGSVQRNIIVSAVPSITFNSSNSGKICVGDKVKISPIVQNATIFQWFKDNNIITGENQNAFETTEAGRYKLELSNSNNCKAVSTDFEVQIFPRTTVTLDSVPSFCGTAFSAIALKANPAGGTFTGNGIIGNSFDPKIAGVGTHTISYKLTRDPACAGGEVTRKVVITPPPILNLGADRDVFQGQTVKLNGDLGTGYQYQWNPPLGLDNPLIPRPLAKPIQTTTYFIRATGPNNCVAVDTITLNVINIIYVPNIFTPNADGLNDTWDISGLETYPDVEISIFNRWGNMVYYAKGNNQKSFDGIFQEKPLPEDTYAFVINTNHKEYVVRGTILLQR